MIKQKKKFKITKERRREREKLQKHIIQSKVLKKKKEKLKQEKKFKITNAIMNGEEKRDRDIWNFFPVNKFWVIFGIFFQ